MKLILCLIILLTTTANAQTFDDPSFQDTQNDQIFFEATTKAEEKKAPTVAPAQAAPAKTDAAADDVVNEMDFFMPDEPEPEIKKQVKRGDAVIKRIYAPGEKVTKTPQMIFISMEDFRLSSLGSFKNSCSMRFTILTNLDEVLNSIDVRLIWPEMNTSISFSNVIPNQTTYVEYTLMGDGCYTMDKVPNLEVNRCRVKGMSQEECSSKISWVQKK